MKEALEIGYDYRHRVEISGEDHQRLAAVQEVMNGTVTLPLPEIQRDEAPAVANMARQGMQQLARRVASVTPSMYFAALNPSSGPSQVRANDRLRVMKGWHHDNAMKRLIGKRARYFLAYASAPVVVKPDKTTGLPRYIVKNPAFTYPANNDFMEMVPPDCIFDMDYTYKQLLDEFGDTPEGYAAIQGVRKPNSWNWDNDVANLNTKFKVLEYVDSEQDALILLGATDTTYPNESIDLTAEFLVNAPNKCGRPLAITPGAINLDKQLGHFDGILGMYQAQAALMALTIIGQRRAIWPREWIVADGGQSPQVDQKPDPYTGQPGIIRFGKIDQQRIDPAFGNLEIQDRLQENQMRETGIPPEFGGLSGNNIRTGRRGAQVMGAAIDFTIAEMQDILAESLMHENKIAISIDKYYFNRSKVYNIATRSWSGQVKYKPKDLWETDAHIVDYPIAGTDLQNLPIEAGQRVAMQTLSRETFMEIDPIVPDPDAEKQRILVEGIDTAVMSSIQTLAADPMGPYQPIHLARLRKLVAGGAHPAEAIEAIQRQIQEEQAQQAPDPASAQPGLSVPGQGVEQPPTIPESGPSMQNLTAVLGQLGTAQQARAYRPVG